MAGCRQIFMRVRGCYACNCLAGIFRDYSCLRIFGDQSVSAQPCSGHEAGDKSRGTIAVVVAAAAEACYTPDWFIPGSSVLPFVTPTPATRRFAASLPVRTVQ